MDAIILTGGRGRRLGALTKHQPKANLRFAGKSLLAYALSALKGSENLIERVYIATGYRAEKVESQYRHDTVEISNEIPVTFLPAESNLSGTFGSAMWALRAAVMNRYCLVLGTDVIITQRAMAEFIASIYNEARTTFLVSPMLTIAPTHGRIRLNSDGEIAEYKKSSLCTHQTSQNWYCDVGLRYFSADFVKECRSLSLAGACDFDDIMPSMVENGRVFESRILNERWLHFANSRDFLQKPL
ncbi:MAG: NTP transferase domain-containing protein [bacterium]|nr:NTP transferase domain-containing protein [bacterium]